MRASTWWTIGWRNLGRNRRRTVLTVAGLAFGFVAVVLMSGLAAGLVAEMIENGTGLVSGQIQIHAAGFRPDRSIHETIGGEDGTEIDPLVAEVTAASGVEAAAPRVYGGGLVSSGESTLGAVLMGIDPELEAGVSRILSTLEQGEPPAEGSNEILIGTETARQLEVGPGDELILVAPAADGSLGNDLYTVSGVFETGLPELDGSYALLPIGSLQRLLALPPDRFHEIAVAVPEPRTAPEIAGSLATRLAPLGLDVEVEPWNRLQPTLADYTRLASSSNWLIMAFIFGMALFGVADTMLMATYERRREFAVLLALGTPPTAIVTTVVFEALALAAVSLVVGTLIATPVMIWWHNAPLDLSWVYGDLTITGALVRPVLRVSYTPTMAVTTAIALLLTAVLSALHPAARAARLPPADTLSGL